ncbi:hypothetical protein L1887_50222 [Cichorium endivia]|nr:hypothetical protein L1887_50222 [Cichorium endivia]
MPLVAVESSPQTTPRADAGPSRFPLSASQPTGSKMPTKSHTKRGSMVGALSVADRAKAFQSVLASSSSSANTVKRNARKSAISSVSASTSASASDITSPSTSAASLADDSEELVATIATARRISVATPVHRRARSDVSVLDPYLAQDLAATASAKPAHELVNPPTIRTSSFAELDELTAKLEANRPRSQTLAHPVRANRANAHLMHSIAEESMHLRLCSSTETIRANKLAPSRRISRSGARTPIANAHVTFQVSPCLSDDGSIDWHCFISTNYGVPRTIDDFRQPISISDLAVPIHAGRKREYHSKLSKPDSPTLNDEATWLEEELARCSSDEDDDDDEYDVDGSHRPSVDEEFSTPDGSPLLSPMDLTAPGPVEIMGLGIQDASLLLPGAPEHQHNKSADSLLEQVAMHEACIRTLHSISQHDTRDHQLSQALPPMPDRRSSLLVPCAQATTLRGVPSVGDFSSTQAGAAALFGDDTYDASMSPMADMGHGALSDEPRSTSPYPRRASAASYLSTASTASADVSTASHASSLLFNAHLAAPGMARGGSADTGFSTRRSSVASSYTHDKAPNKPPRSPLRLNATPLPPLPQEACETPQPSQYAEVPQPRSPTRMSAMPLPPLPASAPSEEGDKPRSSKESARVLRQANRRKEGTNLPQPPARHGSLEAMVAAAPKETQMREEFPERLLGDWMSARDDTATAEAVEASADERAFRVEPVPLHKRILKKDGTTVLPGLGEIVPPSPEVTAAALMSARDVPAYPGAAQKRLGVETLPLAGAAAQLAKPAMTLKGKLSGRRLGRASREEGSASMERKTSESSLPNVLGRMRKASSRSESDRSRVASSAASAAAELPAAWKDRIVGTRPSMDMRRPSFASLASSSEAGAACASPRGKVATLLPGARDEMRSRSSLGLRKMLSSITGTDGASSSEANCSGGAAESAGRASLTLEALAATTFESPKSARVAGWASRGPAQVRVVYRAVGRRDEFERQREREWGRRARAGRATCCRASARRARISPRCLAPRRWIWRRACVVARPRRTSGRQAWGVREPRSARCCGDAQCPTVFLAMAV